MPLGLSKTVKIGAVALGLSLATFAGVSYASVPDTDGTIHGCYTTSSGALRVIDPSTGGSCYSYETGISWNSPQSGLKYYTSTGYVNSQSITETCPDGGIPSSLWVNGNNVLLSNGAGSAFNESLVYPNNDSTKNPDGLSAYSNQFPSSYTAVTYSLICS